MNSGFLLPLATSLAVFSFGNSVAAQVCEDVIEYPVVGDVLQFLPSPDGTRVVYLADQDEDQVFELYSAPLTGGGDVKLNDSLFLGRDVSDEFQISQDGAWVVYLAEQALDNVLTLYSVAMLGGENHRLNFGQALGVVTDFEITPDGSHVVYTERALGIERLWSIAITGGARTQLNPTGTADVNIFEFKVSPDSSRVVYAADQLVNGQVELFTVPVDGSLEARRVNADLPSGGDVRTDFLVGPASAWVYYRSDQERDDVFEVFRNDIAAVGTPVRVSDDLPTSGGVILGDVHEFTLTPAGDRIVYLADQQANSRDELFSRSSDGSGNSVKLNATPVIDGDVLDFLVDPSGSRVVYRGDAVTNGVNELFSAPVDGTGSSVQLSGALVPEGDVQFDYLTDPSGLRVLYRADQSADNVLELFTVPVDGSSPATAVNGMLPDGGDVLSQFLVTESGARVVYRADELEDNHFQLFSAPVDGSGGSQLLDAGAAVFNGMQTLGPDGVVYLGLETEETPNPIEELFYLPADGTTAAYRLNGPLPEGPLNGDVLEYELFTGGTGTEAIYHATYPAGFGVYRIGLEAGSCTEPVLRDPVDDDIEQGIVLTQDETRMLYRRLELSTLTLDLEIIPLDGSSAPTNLSGPLPMNGGVESELLLTASDERVIYRAEGDVNGVVELYSVELDGLSLPVKLSGSLVPDGEVMAGLRLSPRGATVVYRADATLDQIFELFSVPADGTGAPVKLNVPLSVPGSLVEEDFALTPDGARVVFRANQDDLQEVELYSVPLSGGAAPTRLNAPLPSGEDVIDFLITPDGADVVYRAFQENDFTLELYVVSVTGGIPRKLNLPFSNGGSVGEASLSADGATVVFTAREGSARRAYSVPLDGSSSAIDISGVLAPNVSVLGATVTPDGSRVLFTAGEVPGGTVELFSGPTDASTPPVRLNSTLVQEGDVEEFVNSADGSQVVYLADGEEINRHELYAVPVDGSQPARRVSGELIEGGDVVAGSFRVQGSDVLFMADALMDGSIELFASALDGSGGPRRLSHAAVRGRRRQAGGASIDGSVEVSVKVR